MSLERCGDRYKLAVGDWLKRQRMLLGLTQAEVGDAIGVAPSTVSHWERGLHEMGGCDDRALRALFKRLWAERGGKQPEGVDDGG